MTEVHDTPTTPASPEHPASPVFAYDNGGAGVDVDDEPEFQPRPRRRAHALTFALGGAVTGTVKLVDGNNVYVTDTAGNVVKVATGASSQLTKTDPATTKDVAPGDVVIVRGAQNSDGSYTAQSLVISTPAATGG